MSNDIRIIIAEDSPTVRHHLAKIIEEAPGIRVVGEARNGLDAIKLVEELRPDVVSMDIRMPRLDGLEATRRIMSQVPTPIVVVSGLVESDIELSFSALQAGALAVVKKPPDRRNPDFPVRQQELVKTLKAMASVSVVSRRHRITAFGQQDTTEAGPARQHITGKEHPEILAIGASTGGPSAISSLLRELPANLPVPIAVVQHMTDDFIAGLARWLDTTTPLTVRLAENGEYLEPGVVHLSPGGVHLNVARVGVKLAARLVHEPGPYRYQPSVDSLFESVARVCNSAAIGCVLTGMGDDGAHGLRAMHDAGAYTFAQDEASSTVFGMPQAAIAYGAAENVVSLAEMPAEILKII